MSWLRPTVDRSSSSSCSHWVRMKSMRCPPRGRSDMPSRYSPISTVLVIGVSEGPVCGVRDHGNRLSEGLQRGDLTVVASWWERTSGRQLREELREARRLSLIHISEPTRRTPISY